MTEEGQRAGRRGFSVLAAFGSVLGAFLYSTLDLEMFPFPLIEQLQAAKLSSVLLLACSSFLHFLYKELGRGRRKTREIEDSVETTPPQRCTVCSREINYHFFSDPRLFDSISPSPNLLSNLIF